MKNLQHMKNLKAGHYYEIDISTLDIEEKQYFDLKGFYMNKNSLSFEESLNKLDNLLHKSIKNRII